VTDDEFENHLLTLVMEGHPLGDVSADMLDHAEGMRADLARVTEERDRLARERDEAHTALSEAARSFVAGDRYTTRLLLCDVEARTHAGRTVARIRAEARAEALEEAAAAVYALGHCRACGDDDCMVDAAADIRALAKKGGD
jgi:methyl coenzyme M reductase subunit C-like uncharacterized protein (methanogenesis marker protein 7)